VANLLDRFNKNAIGSKGNIADYISIIISSGDFKRVTNLEVILNSWSNILLTPLRTYDHDPTYGSDLYKMIFEPADEMTSEKIEREIESKITLFDDRATIEDISIDFLTNQKGFNLSITVDYEGTSGELKTTIDESLYFKFMEVTE